MRKVTAIVLVVMASVVLAASVMAESNEKVTGRSVLHYTKSETIEVGDAPGHVVGVGQQSGLVFYSTGEVAKKTATFHFDLLKGEGTYRGYTVITDKDGSSRFNRMSGTTAPVDGGKKFVLEGNIECNGGTGKYEGFKGTGTFKGERIGDLKTGGEAYYDFTMNCRKP
jgi:hypothetical protein